MEKKTEAQRQKIAESRQRNRQLNELMLNGSPVCYLTGFEKDAFDFSKPICAALYPVGRYDEADKLVASIRNPEIWQNVELIKLMIAEHCITKCNGRIVRKHRPLTEKGKKHMDRLHEWMRVNKWKNKSGEESNG
jgi:hypothetical protein